MEKFFLLLLVGIVNSPQIWLLNEKSDIWDEARAIGGDRRFWGQVPSLSKYIHWLVDLQLVLDYHFKSSEVFILYLIIQSGIKQWDLIAHGYNLSTWGPEAGGSQVQGQPRLGSESLGQ